MKNKQNRIVGITGCKGAGKSYWAKQQFLKSKRAICFDTCAEYESGLVTSDRQEFLDYLMKNKNYKICFLPRTGDQDLLEDFNWVARCAYAAGDVDFFVEEIDYFCGPNYNEPGLDRVIRYGRHKQVNLYYTTRRFQEISRGLTGMSDAFILFRISEPSDLDSLRKRFGDSISDQVSALQDHSHVSIEVRELRKTAKLSTKAENNEIQQSDSDSSLRDSDSVRPGETERVPGSAPASSIS